MNLNKDIGVICIYDVRDKIIYNSFAKSYHFELIIRSILSPFMSHFHFIQTTKLWMQLSGSLTNAAVIQTLLFAILFVIFWIFRPWESAPRYTRGFRDFHSGHFGQLNSVEYIPFLLPNIIHLQCIKNVTTFNAYGWELVSIHIILMQFLQQS